MHAWAGCVDSMRGGVELGDGPTKRRKEAERRKGAERGRGGQARSDSPTAFLSEPFQGWRGTGAEESGESGGSSGCRDAALPAAEARSSAEQAAVSIQPSLSASRASAGRRHAVAI